MDLMYVIWAMMHLHEYRCVKDVCFFTHQKKLRQVKGRVLLICGIFIRIRTKILLDLSILSYSASKWQIL